METTMGRLMDTAELQAYTRLGRNNAMKMGEEAGAKVKYGKRVLWDKQRIDLYLNELRGEGTEKYRKTEGRTN